MQTEVVAEGFGYLESPRWHRGQLWFSDLQYRMVFQMAPTGATSPYVEVPGRPGGLGFTRSGDLLVVSMTDRRVCRLTSAGLACHADLSAHTTSKLNDMVVMRDGRCFVGAFGYDLARREQPRPAPLLTVSTGGEVGVAAAEMLFANGMCSIDDGGTLLVAETSAQQITAFTLGADGALSDRRIFASIAPRAADGICADLQGGVWLGSPFTSEFVRIEAGGRVTHTIATPGRWAVACAFGGDDLGDLYLLTAETDMGRFHKDQSSARVEVVRAPVPGTN